MASRVSSLATARVSAKPRVSSRPRVTSTICRARSGPRDDDVAPVSLPRRALFAGAALASLSPPPAARADEVSAGAPMKEYRDEQDKYAFSVPSDWVQAEGVTSDNPQSTRRVVAFYPPDQPEINVSVVATSLGADYPKMGSFGSPDEFAYGVAAGMTRPKPREGPKQFSYVVDAKALDAKYALEYTVERPTENFYQHLYSVVGIGYNGRVNRLFTLTAVCPEDKYADAKDALKKIAATFETPPTLYP